MNKIKITITEFGWKKKLVLNGKVYDEKHVRTSFGSSGKSVFKNIDEIPAELLEAIQNLNEYDTMKALKCTSVEDFENQ